MEFKSAKILHDTDESRNMNEATESNASKNDVKDFPRPVPSSPGNKVKINMADWNAQGPNAPVNKDGSGELNMEASITPDDVTRAGGLGARDDIGSFLPVASDATDFEATILDAKNYEEPQGEETCRPGLGWAKPTERK